MEKSNNYQRRHDLKNATSVPVTVTDLVELLCNCHLVSQKSSEGIRGFWGYRLPSTHDWITACRLAQLSRACQRAVKWHFARLRSLSIDSDVGSVIDSAGLMVIARNCMALEQLTLYEQHHYHCSCPGARPYRPRVWPVANGSTGPWPVRTAHRCLTCEPLPGLEGLRAILQKCTKLQELELHGKFILDNSICYALARSARQLTRLVFEYECDVTAMTSVGLASIATGCDKLRELKLKFSDNVSEFTFGEGHTNTDPACVTKDAVRAISELLLQIENLEVICGPDLSDDAFQGTVWPSLKALVVVQHRPPLLQFNLTGLSAPNLNELHMLPLPASLEVLGRTCPQLESLSLGPCGRPSYCSDEIPNIHTYSFNQLNVPHLKGLHLHGIRWSEDVLSTFPPAAALPSVTSLDLSDTDLTCTAIEHIARQSPGLRHVELKYNKTLPHNVGVVLLRHWPLITHLTLDVTNIHDDTIDWISRLSKLEHLSIDLCDHVSDNGLLCLVQNCTSLLDLSCIYDDDVEAHRTNDVQRTVERILAARRAGKELLTPSLGAYFNT